MEDRIFEITVAESHSRRSGGDWERDNRLLFHISDEAELALTEKISPYGHRSGNWFLDKVNFGKPPAGWTYIFLPDQMPIANEIRMAREGIEDKIAFLPYERPPEPITDNFEPMVGCIIAFSRAALRDASLKSEVLDRAWVSVRSLNQRKRWMCIIGEVQEQLF
jgi:hypothetical protein